MGIPTPNMSHALGRRTITSSLYLISRPPRKVFDSSLIPRRIYPRDGGGIGLLLLYTLSLSYDYEGSQKVSVSFFCFFCFFGEDMARSRGKKMDIVGTGTRRVVTNRGHRHWLTIWTHLIDMEEHFVWNILFFILHTSLLWLLSSVDVLLYSGFKSLWLSLRMVHASGAMTWLARRGGWKWRPF